MFIVLDIPEDFINEYNKDNFRNSLQRFAEQSEYRHASLVHRYQEETLSMLVNALEHSEPLLKEHEEYYNPVAITKEGLKLVWESLTLNS